jgi:repressor LexA
MHKEKLTDRQLGILNMISEFIMKRGYSPSYRDIAKSVKLASPSTVVGHLEKLKEKGYVTWEPGCPRTLQILKTAS